MLLYLYVHTKTLTNIQCFELEKNPRVPRKDAKGKSSKGKEKEIVYDANEASLHDKALANRLLIGYDAFKVWSGKFIII